MKFEIKSWINGKILFECEADSIKLAVEKAIGANANLSYADLRSADLSSANLSYADLRSADLRSADLSSANLRSTDLSSANLSYADLRSADLSSANLSYADLSYADLRSADLRSANLRSANLSSTDLSSANLLYAEIDDDHRIETGETWKEYKEQTVPALLTAGGKSLAEVSKAWDCHDWNNCPIATAFSVHSIDKVPVLFRPRAEQFIRYFDAKMLPCPVAEKE